MAAALGLAPPRSGLTKLGLPPVSATPRCGTTPLHVTSSPALSSETKHTLAQPHDRASRAQQRRRLCTHAAPGGGAALGLPLGDDGGEFARASAAAAERGPGTLHAAEVGSLTRRTADAGPPNALEARSLCLPYRVLLPDYPDRHALCCAQQCLQCCYAGKVAAAYAVNLCFQLLAPGLAKHRCSPPMDTIHSILAGARGAAGRAARGGVPRGRRVL